MLCDAGAVQGAIGTPPGGEDLINTVPAQSLQSQSIPCSASSSTLSGLVGMASSDEAAVVSPGEAL